jgi:Dehydrogenases with different specificities (related to short-chain alcohol dehydrogenases)
VSTPLLQELFAKDPERAARRLVHVLLGRFAEPEEIAAAVAFLASDDASSSPPRPSWSTAASPART